MCGHCILSSISEICVKNVHYEACIYLDNKEDDQINIFIIKNNANFKKEKKNIIFKTS